MRDHSGNYDGAEHNPKLLPCSHTICIECLTRIVATFARDSQFRYEMCSNSHVSRSLTSVRLIFVT